MNYHRRPLVRQKSQGQFRPDTDIELIEDIKVDAILKESIDRLLAALRFDPANPTCDESDESLEANIYDYANYTDASYFGMLDNSFKIISDEVS
jgi:hypothetical protein